MKSAIALPGTNPARLRQVLACLVILAILFFCTPAAQINLPLNGSLSLRSAPDQASVTTPRELRRSLGPEEAASALAPDATGVDVFLAPPVAKPIILKHFRKETFPAGPALPTSLCFRPPPVL